MAKLEGHGTPCPYYVGIRVKLHLIFSCTVCARERTRWLVSLEGDAFFRAPPPPTIRFGLSAENTILHTPFGVLRKPIKKNAPSTKMGSPYKGTQGHVGPFGRLHQLVHLTSHLSLKITGVPLGHLHQHIFG